MKKSNEDLIKYLIDIGALKSKNIINTFKLIDRKHFCLKGSNTYEDRPQYLGYGVTIRYIKI
jgi:hypothetical protein